MFIKRSSILGRVTVHIFFVRGNWVGNYVVQSVKRVDTGFEQVVWRHKSRAGRHSPSKWWKHGNRATRACQLSCPGFFFFGCRWPCIYWSNGTKVSSANNKNQNKISYRDIIVRSQGHWGWGTDWNMWIRLRQNVVFSCPPSCRDTKNLALYSNWALSWFIYNFLEDYGNHLVRRTFHMSDLDHYLNIVGTFVDRIDNILVTAKMQLAHGQGKADTVAKGYVMKAFGQATKIGIYTKISVSNVASDVKRARLMRSLLPQREDSSVRSANNSLRVSCVRPLPCSVWASHWRFLHQSNCRPTTINFQIVLGFCIEERWLPTE